MIAPVLAVLAAAELLEELDDYAETSTCPYCRRAPGCSHVGDCPFGRLRLVLRALVDDDALAALAKVRRMFAGGGAITAKLAKRAAEEAQREAVSRAAAVAETRKRAGLPAEGA